VGRLAGSTAWSTAASTQFGSIGSFSGPKPMRVSTGHTDEQRHQHGYVDLRLRRFDVPGFVVVERVNLGGASCLQPARRGRTEAQDCPAGPRGGAGGERG
jgi:hypothetical protein